MPEFVRQFDNFSIRVPQGDARERLVCNACDFVHYDNPKIVVGSVITNDDGHILMCKRSIEPRKGYWTLPAGFMEEHETTEDGAIRETLEEACAHIEIEALLAIYSIPRISQVQLMYKARLIVPDSGPAFAAGEESEEVALVRWDDIPWDEIAFPSVHWALTQYNEVKDQAVFAPFSNPVQGL